MGGVEMPQAIESIVFVASIGASRDGGQRSFRLKSPFSLGGLERQTLGITG